MNKSNNKIKISIVAPLFNEEGSIKQLYTELISVLESVKEVYEIIFINDGSKDNSQSILDELYLKDKEHVRVIEFRRNFGKAAALRAGFDIVRGEIVITLDADLQDDPAEIPKFIQKINEGYDLVSGWKKNRRDSFIKNNTSKIYNFFTSLISEIGLHDHNCGFKAYKSEVVKNLNLYGQLHRYIPVLAAADGFNKITEIKVRHRKREFGKTKYGPIRFIHGFLDLLTVIFITRYRSRPLHFFAYLGLIFFSAGFLIGVYLTAVKFLTYQSIGDKPLLLLLSVMLMIVGVQIGIAGLAGEQIISSINNKGNRNYSIKKILK